jgi:hypothetical protein
MESLKSHVKYTIRIFNLHEWFLQKLIDVSWPSTWHNVALTALTKSSNEDGLMSMGAIGSDINFPQLEHYKLIPTAAGTSERINQL